MQMKSYTNALNDFNVAITINPKFANGYLYYMRGNTYGILGDFDKAIVDHKKALEINPNFEEARRSLQADYENMKMRG